MSAGNTRYWFEVNPQQNASIDLVEKMLLEEFGIRIERMRQRRSSRFAEPAGEGFGDRVWRVNYIADCIEVSFNHPCWQSKAVKQGGMKWNHVKGIWYGPNTQQMADMCGMLKLTQVDSVNATAGMLVPQ